MSTLDLGDIQGVVLRQYQMPFMRNYLLKVTNPQAARDAVSRFVSGNEAEAPQVSSSLDVPAGAAYRLHIGFTWLGLIALGLKDRVPGLSFQSFAAFMDGAAKRAQLLHDIGESGPEHWIDGFATDDAHAVVTLYAVDVKALDWCSSLLSALLANGFETLWQGDGAAFIEMEKGRPVTKVHFGYCDPVTQVTISGGPGPYPADSQQPCEPWRFVLLDEAKNYYVPQPPQLGRNGSFGVFRVIEQNVVAFEEFLLAHKDRIDPELLAAKIMGRWRNGVPLALSPDSPTPSGGLSPDQYNNFNYVNKDGSGDPLGVRTPIGAHIRRVNPRGQPVQGQGFPGGSNNSHRVIRRLMPYGPRYDPAKPPDGIERGIMGYFVNSMFENQFEFVVREWLSNYQYVGASRLDPTSKGMITATTSSSDRVFQIPQPGGAPTLNITGFRNFVTTRAAAYCFLPSITALKFIASSQ
jgi:deferrochelatase/peroxidase EfeB